MLITKGSREDAIRVLINLWLKDPRKYCATCCAEYDYHSLVVSPCCENPLYNNNTEILKLFMRDLKMVKETRANDYASNKDKTMRFGISMPPSLLHFLETSMKTMYHEKLFSREYPLTWFMKKFPQFAIPTKV